MFPPPEIVATPRTDTRLRPRPADAASPLSAVDEVTAWDRGSISATKTVDRRDPYMDGHFPGFTVYPGVFVLETVAQAAGTALGVPVELVGVRSMRFTAPLLAGETLVVEARVAPGSAPGSWAIDADCRRRDGAAAAAVKLDVRALEAGGG